MKKRIYFKNIPHIGDLFFEHTLFEFNNIPIVFLCTDKKSNIYLCLCTDAMFQYCCMIISISQSKLIALIEDEMSVYDIFKECDEDIIVANYINKRFEYIKLPFESIPEEDLPYENEFLELDVLDRIKLKNGLLKDEGIMIKDTLSFDDEVAKFLNILKTNCTIQHTDSKTEENTISSYTIDNNNDGLLSTNISERVNAA